MVDWTGLDGAIHLQIDHFETISEAFSYVVKIFICMFLRKEREKRLPASTSKQ